MNISTKDKVEAPGIVSASSVDANDIKCPACKGSHLILDGYLQRIYTITSKDGKVLTTKTEDGPWVHDIKVIRCQSEKCKQTYNIVSDEMWHLMQAASTGTKIC